MCLLYIEKIEVEVEIRCEGGRATAVYYPAAAWGRENR